MAFVRVRHNKTGHKFSIDERAVRDHHTVLKQDAVDRNGKPLPPEHKTPATSAASASTPTPNNNKE